MTWIDYLLIGLIVGSMVIGALIALVCVARELKNRDK